MKNINKVMLAGNIVRDAEVVQVGSYSVVKFTVATTRKWTDSSKNKKEETEFHNVERWNSEGIAKFLLKGVPVFVEGRIKSEKFEKRDGTKGSSFKIMADDVSILRFKDEGEKREVEQTFGEEAPF